MSSLTRRDAIVAGTAVVAGGFAGVAAAVEPTHADPALEAIETRMTAVENRGTTLNARQKYAVLLSVVTAAGTSAPVARLVKAALKAGVTPVEVKEILYQCAPYTGLGRVDNVLPEANRAMQEAGVKLPLPDQTQVTDEDRLAKGIEVQTAIFGDVITNDARRCCRERKGSHDQRPFRILLRGFLHPFRPFHRRPRIGDFLRHRRIGRL